MGKRCVKAKKFSREYRVICHKIKISTNLFPMKDAILVWFTTAIKRLLQVVQAQTKLQIEKKCRDYSCRKFGYRHGKSASRFELALFMRK